MISAADVTSHAARAALLLRRGQADHARWEAIFCGVAAAKVAHEAGAEAPEVPAEMMAEPFRAWVEEGIAMARHSLANPPPAHHSEPAFRPRPGNTHAAHACGREDFEL